MIILQFDFAVHGRPGLIYSGDSTFGFFTKSALASQKQAHGWHDRPADERDSLPSIRGSATPSVVALDSMLRMIDTVEGIFPLPASQKGFGGGVDAAERKVVVGRTRVDPQAWFFRAHFHDDPIWPGSLGLEALIQLLKAYALERWGNSTAGWRTASPNDPHQWSYRGQILPTASEVTVQASITEVDDAQRFVKADGILAVDGRMIYEMKGFSLRG
jgi:3-hydroxymyristoyl/3-hydroxydecanoyl-(acyl carrier protein) dehydratase